MKTVTHVLYSFDELSEVAKSKAINQLKQRAAIDYSDFDWELENESEQWFLNLAQCKVCVEQSSQGFYCRWHQEIDRDCNKTDEKLFRELQQRIQDEFKDDNFNHVFRTKCLGSRNKQNVVLATIAGLAELKTPDEVARLRGKSVDEIVG